MRFCDTTQGFDGCAEEAADKRFTSTYVGPDGVRDSWLTQTRMFTPTRKAKPTRALGTITARPNAALSGTFAGGPRRFVRLLRGDGTTAVQTRTDDAGHYRFEVAPGRYRVEVDRIETLRTVDTVPGFRSRLLHLTARRATTLDFTSKPAATIYGRVTAKGEPVADQFVAITDERGRFAAGVGTDTDGRYSLDSLKPGRYTLSTPAAATSYLPTRRSFTIDTSTATRADLELTDGARIVLTPVDTTSSGADSTVIVELRNADGAITKAGGGASGEASTFSGLTPGRYQVGARRADDNSTPPTFPWAERSVTVSGTQTVDLGAVSLDQTTLNLSGTVPPHARIRITPLPDVAYLRKDFTEGSGVTGLSVTWLTDADAAGHYKASGLVPGHYLVVVTAQLDEEANPVVYRGNIAATSTMLTVTTKTKTADFAAPRGGRVTGRFRYAGTHRPVIAPFAFQVHDEGLHSRLFPLLSKPQRYRGGFTVDRLHRGHATGSAVDIQQVLDLADFQAEELPQNLIDSAANEPATPYWFTSTRKRFHIKAGQTTDIGWVDLRVHR